MGIFLLLVAAMFPVMAVAQQQEGFTTGVPETKRVGKTEPVSGGDGAVEIPYSQIFRDTEPPYEKLFRDIRVGGRMTSKIGSADSLFETHLFSGPIFRVPLLTNALAPMDAQLKIGPLYLSVHSVSASLLYSDNVNLTEFNREDGLIGIMRMRLVAVLQLGDKLQLHTTGTLVYFPFKGEIGIAGFGIDDPVVVFEERPLAQTQLTYDTRVGGWDVELVDDLRARYRRFSGLGYDLFDGEQFDEEDRAGRYVFRDSTRSALDTRYGNGGRTWGGDYIEGRNLVGASVGRLLPTETKFEVGGYHADYFYYGSHDSQLPDSRDSAYVMLVSERETMRFQPFARYRVSKYDYQDNWEQEGHAGLRGPVTENLWFLGDVGYAGVAGGRLLWNLRLRHTINRLTYQQLLYRRGRTEPDNALEELLSYRISHAFRQDLVGHFYASRAIYEALDRATSSGEDDRLGLRFTYRLAQRTMLEVGGAYARITYQERRYSDSDTWIARAQLRYEFRRWLEGRLTYQYHDRNASRVGDSFYENLLMLTVIRYF